MMRSWLLGLSFIWVSSLAAEVPFISFDGTDYLKTDYMPTPKTCIEVDFALTDAPVQQFIVHAGSEDPADLHLRVYENGCAGWSWNFSDTKNFDPYLDGNGKRVPVVINQRLVAVIDGHKGIASLAESGKEPFSVAKMETQRTAKTKTIPLTLFYNPFQRLKTKGKLYGLKIFEAGKPVHEYKAVCEKGEEFLRDMITGKELHTEASKREFRTFRTPVGALKGVEGHVQGISCTDEAIYLSFITTLVKIDWQGNVLKRVPVRRHMGDVAYHHGKIFGCLGKTKDPNKGLGGTAYLQVFDDDFNLLGERATPFAPGIDGIAIDGDTVYIGGGSKGNGNLPHRENLVVRLNGKLEPTAKAWIDYGVETKHGIQNVAVADGKVWCFFYPYNPEDIGCAVLDKDLNLIKVMDFPAGNGVDVLPPRFGKSKHPRFLVCKTIWPKDDNGVRAEFHFVEIREHAAEL